MRLKTTVLLCLLAIGMCHMKTTTPQVIVWDLGDTLFQRSWWSQIKAMGLWDGFWFFFRYGRSSSDVMRSLMWDVLNLYKAPLLVEGKFIPRDPYGNPLPNLMIEWFIGTKTSQEVLAIVKDCIARYEGFKSPLEKRMIEKVFTWMFTPRAYAESWVPVREAVSLLKLFAGQKDAQGNPLFKFYILSNFDQETYYHLSSDSDNSVVFDNFKPEHIFISGQKRTLKPEPRFFFSLLESAGVSPKEVVLIDDQEENCAMARSLGMHAFCVKDGNFENVRRGIERIGMLPDAQKGI